MDAGIAISRWWTASAVFFAICFILCSGEGHSQRKRLDGFHSSCSKCPPGFGVVHRCTLSEDTVCHSCEYGYYATGYSKSRPCLPCSRCGEGLFEAHRCTATKDTVCDACINHRPHAGNQDYDRKCVGRFRSNNPAQINSIAAHNPNPFMDTPSNWTLPSLPEEESTRDNLKNSSFVESTDDVAVGVAQLAAFQVVLIFTAVSAILALTCRLRICTPETTRLKSVDKDAEDGVALVDEVNDESP